MTPLNKTVVIVGLLGGVVLMATVYPLFSIVEFNPSPPDMAWLERAGGVYEASATILAVVSLGSILGVRIDTDPEQAKIQKAALYLVLGCSGVVVLAQVLTMIGICCLGLGSTTYAIYLGVTGLSLLTMFGGYATLIRTQALTRRTRSRRGKRTNVITGKKVRQGVQQDQDK